MTEAGQDTGIDGIGFGEDAECFGEIPNLPRVDNNGGQRGREQGADGRFLIVAGRLENDALGGELASPLDQLGDAGRVVGEAALLRVRQSVRVEAIFTDIDPKDAFHKSSETMRYCKAGGTEGITCSGW